MKHLTLLISIIAVVAVALPGCSAKWHLKRAARHELIAISKGAQVRADTVYVNRIVPVPEIRVDTVFKNVNFMDTLIVTKEKVVTRVKVDPILRTVYVTTQVKPDTVRIKVPIIVEKKFTAKSGLDWWILILIGFFGAIVLYFIIRK